MEEIWILLESLFCRVLLYFCEHVGWNKIQTTNGRCFLAPSQIKQDPYNATNKRCLLRPRRTSFVLNVLCVDSMGYWWSWIILAIFLVGHCEKQEPGFPKNLTRYPRPGLQPWPLNPEARALTMSSPRLHGIRIANVVQKTTNGRRKRCKINKGIFSTDAARRLRKRNIYTIGQVQLVIFSFLRHRLTTFSTPNFTFFMTKNSLSMFEHHISSCILLGCMQSFF